MSKNPVFDPEEHDRTEDRNRRGGSYLKRAVLPARIQGNHDRPWGNSPHRVTARRSEGPLYGGYRFRFQGFRLARTKKK